MAAVPYLHFIRAHPRFLAYGFAMTFCSSFGQTFFISLSGGSIRETFELDHGGFGLLYSLATLASGISIIWLGQKLDSIDLRRFSAVICIGLALACLGLSIAGGLAMLFAAIYLLRLTGQGLLSHAAMTSMARYFDADRGKAMSIAGLGFPAGEAVLPLVAVATMAAVGWRQTWLIIAGGLVLLGLPAILVLLRGQADRHRAHVQSLAGGDAAGHGHGGIRQWSRREVLRHPGFYLVLPAVVAPGFIVTGLFFHQIHLVESRGWTMELFAACFAAFAAMQLISGLLAGPLVDRLGGRRLLPIFLLPMCAGLLVLAAGTDRWIAPAFMALTGLTAGISSTIVGAVWAEQYGVRHLGAIRAMVTAIGVFGTAASPALMGVMIDAGVSMERIAAMCGAYAIVASVLAAGGTRSAGIRLHGGASGDLRPAAPVRNPDPPKSD